MILKEAYRYQNYLSNLISSAEGYLCKKDFITETTQTHNRKKVNPEAEDEVMVVKTSYNVDFTPMQLIEFINKALVEKQKLTNAIDTAKKNAEINIDSSIEMNRVKQGYISVLSSMTKTKPSETISKGSGYKFNADGNQVAYYYDIDNVTTINFDRNDVRGILKKLQRETDDVSTKIDAIQATAEVDYEPVWDLSDSLEDIVG